LFSELFFAQEAEEKVEKEKDEEEMEEATPNGIERQKGAPQSRKVSCLEEVRALLLYTEGETAAEAVVNEWEEEGLLRTLRPAGQEGGGRRRSRRGTSACRRQRSSRFGVL
jgi:hypothetical protein